MSSTIATRSPCQTVVRTVVAASAPPHRGQGAAACWFMSSDRVGSLTTKDTKDTKEKYYLCVLCVLGGSSYARIIWTAASTIFGASGRSQRIIPAAPGPGTSGKASFLAFTPGTACATSAMTCDP